MCPTYMVLFYLETMTKHGSGNLCSVTIFGHFESKFSNFTSEGQSTNVFTTIFKKRTDCFI